MLNSEGPESTTQDIRCVQPILFVCIVVYADKLCGIYTGELCGVYTGELYVVCIQT